VVPLADSVLARAIITAARANSTIAPAPLLAAVTCAPTAVDPVVTAVAAAVLVETVAALWAQAAICMQISRISRRFIASHAAAGP
jgi:hypothetical protein